jgi:hypothetical protein
MASSEGAIRGATEVGAVSVPQAALHLRLAQEQTVQAKALIKDGETERAELVLMRAQADAELALALAKEDTSRKGAEAAMEQVRALSANTR